MKNRMLLIAALAILVAAPAMAFHHGGVAYCQGCHTMHNSQSNLAMNENATGTGVGTAPGTGYEDLLLLPNATDTCLNCHGGNTSSYNVFESDPLGPTLSEYYSAGNFVFLLEDNINDGRGGSTNPIPGQQSGHNVRSGIKGSNWDTTLLTPPGGSSVLGNNNLECTSCHDPHGTDSFRLLYQENQVIDVANDSVTFQGTIVADSISYSSVETNNNHNAYKSGYSEWCSSCHPNFHSASGNFIHPSGEFLTQDIIDKYNSYRGTADCIANPPAGGSPCGSGDSQTAYLADVPFESPIGITTVSTDGPLASNAKVACVSCHRAHATSAKDAGRWDFTIAVLDDDGLTSGSWAIPNAYPGTEQKSLCNKCHTQDEYDHAAE